MAFVVASQILVIAVCLAVAGRILWLARQTGGRPELLIGLGLGTIVLTLPLLVVSGLGRVPAGEIRLGALAGALLFLWAGQTLIAAFTWQTFRRRQAWGTWLLGFIGVSQAATCIGAFLAVAGLAPDADATIGARDWLAGIRMPGTLAYAWTAIEGFHEYARARRRQTLGLSDPIVVNRLWMWGLVGTIAVANNLVSTGLQLVGLGPVHTPAGAMALAVGGTLSAGALYLAFLPPAAYRRWVLARATG